MSNLLYSHISTYNLLKHHLFPGWHTSFSPEQNNRAFNMKTVTLTVEYFLVIEGRFVVFKDRVGLKIKYKTCHDINY